MNLTRNLLVAVAATGVIGSAQAAAPVYLGTLTPAVLLGTGTYATATTFTDIFNFTVGAKYQTVLASAIGTSAPLTSVSNLMLTIYSSDRSVVGRVSSSNGSLIDLSGFLLAGSYSAEVSGLANGSLGGGYRFSVSATPEPAEWMLLMCGLMVAGFIARQKMNLVTAA
jgi:hypothetical protein